MANETCPEGIVGKPESKTKSALSAGSRFRRVRAHAPAPMDPAEAPMTTQRPQRPPVLPRMVFLEPAERGLNIVVANMAHVLARLYWVTPEGGRQPGTSHGVARSLQIATIRVDLSLPISSAIIGYVSGARVHVARTIGNEQECVVAIRIRLVRAIEDTILKHLGRIARQRGRPTPGSRAQEVVPTTTAAHEEDEHFIWVSRVYSKAVGVAEGAAGPQPPDLEARLPPAVRLGGQAAERDAARAEISQPQASEDASGTAGSNMLSADTKGKSISSTC
eukprot:CAMPEP_0115540470 /NCGR_PEP_ID=MMETSP0271-20121206/89946_1 /TAXON_ID=71861 /ORGANISM="Scrippsiella trochoidea, Strain CCMP3099" /LENGTH=276 /DNA_ID=CAMNT_0002973469 /DNA_START=606 /DNA_END=1435 /DNA_ORIENTATION=-